MGESATAPLLFPEESSTQEHGSIFRVTRRCFGKVEKTVFSGGQVSHTVSYNFCGCTPSTTKIIRGSRLESSEHSSPGVDYRGLFWAWLLLGNCGAHRFMVGRYKTGFALASTFLIGVVATAISWSLVLRIYCTGPGTCYSGRVFTGFAIGSTLFLVSHVLRWFIDLFFLRSWLRTYITLKTNNDSTDITISTEDVPIFTESIHNLMSSGAESV